MSTYLVGRGYTVDSGRMSPRVLTAVFIATLAAGTAGCGFVEQGRNLAEHDTLIDEFTALNEKAAGLTYTAKYRVTDGRQVTLVQQPPNSTVLIGGERLITTPTAVISCEPEDGGVSCLRTPVYGKLTSDVREFALARRERVQPIHLMISLAAFSGAPVERSEKTIAGQKAVCATTGGLDAEAQPDDPNARRDFSACVTEAGILASYRTTTDDGEPITVELMSLSDDVDAAMFAPPPGAVLYDPFVLPSG
jgi:hypothetical protein